MRQPTSNRRRGVPAALWSEFLALWRVCARRPAWPLVLALLLFAAAPLTAPMDCSLEASGHSHNSQAGESHHHADDGHHPDDTSDHHDHAQVTVKGAALQAPASCSCSSEPVNAVVAAVSAPHQYKTDSHAVTYVVADVAPAYRVDALRGLNTRAGPPGKSQRLSLVCQLGPAPPVSL